MNVKALLIAETLIFAALYFALTFILAPISFLPLQVRVSDSLIMLSAVLGLPVVYGVFLGCILANLFPVGYPPNPVDVVFGSLANLIASYLVYLTCYGRAGRRRILLAGIMSSIIVSLIVGSYLPFLIMPNVSWQEVVWIGYLGVLPGELIAQAGLGSALTLTLTRIPRLQKPPKRKS